MTTITKDNKGIFQFKIDQPVYYLEKTKSGIKVHSAPILSRMYVDNKWSKKKLIKIIATDEQQDTVQFFGEDCILYATIHGIYNESCLFESKKDLVKSILDNEDI